MSIESVIAPYVNRTSSDDPHEFAASQPGFDSRYLPTTNDHRFLRMELLLPSGRLMIVRRPPVAFEGMVSADRGLITFLLDEGPTAKVNGRQMAGSKIAVWKKGTCYRGSDDFPVAHCSLLISDALAERGFPEAEGHFSIGADRSTSLRSRIREILTIIEHDPIRFMNPNALRGVDQSIVGGIDDALLEAGAVRSGAAVGRYVSICKRAQEYMNESRHRIYSGIEVAHACGVSVRTLHNAFISVLDMSPNKYFLLHRLWLTRRALLESSDQKLVKSIALDHGFWHLGRFSRIYYSKFGELPSTTLASRRPQSKLPEIML